MLTRTVTSLVSALVAGWQAAEGIVEALERFQQDNETPFTAEACTFHGGEFTLVSS